MRQLRKLVLGETWSLPAGLAVLVLVALLVRAVAGAAWDDVGGPLLLAGVLVVLVVCTRAAR